MRVLITGAGGFIGSHLVEALVRAGHSVRCNVNYNSRGDRGHFDQLDAAIQAECDVRPFDIRDAGAVDAAVAGIDAVAHLAALIGIPYSYTAPASYVAVNIQGTLNLLNAARTHDIERFIHTSTSEVYGSARYTPIDEAHPLVGQSPYSATKIAADKLVESYACAFEVPAITIRPFNTFGPRQSSRAIIPTLVAQLLDDSINEVSAGSMTTIRDFTYVSDTVRAFVLALGAVAIPEAATLNLGTGVGYTINEVYETLQDVAHIRKPVRLDAARVRPVRSEVLELVSNNALAATVLGWQPQVPLREGLKFVVDYARERPASRPLAFHV